MAQPEVDVDVLGSAAHWGGLDARRAWGMLESAPDGMLLTDDDGVVLAVNRQVERLFGYDRAELVGQRIELLLPERVRDAHEVHRNRYQAEPVVRSMGAGLDLLARRRDGSEFPVEVGLSPLTDDGGPAVVASIRDVSERLAVERRLTLSEETFRTSFENAPVGMTLACVEPDGRIMLEQVNTTFAALLGGSVDSLVGVDLVTILHPDDQHQLADAAGEMAAGARDALETETRYRRADGTHVWLLVHACVIDRSDGARTLSHLIDITDRRGREAARERMTTMEDRERIARDIHDLVIQRLFGAGMRLQAAIPEMGSEAAVVRAHETIDELDLAIRELRSAIFSLHHRAGTRSATAELTEAIERAVDRLGFRPRYVVDGPVDAIDAVQCSELVATVREALANVARHAGASSAHVGVEVSTAVISLTVVDNGCGIDPSQPRGEGLANMATRAARLGGSLVVDSPDAGGCALTWTIPRR
jgi:PAS domain S-box-containing protein